MERAIDRKEYRRNYEESKVDEDIKVELLRGKLKGFLFQSLGASIALLIVSFLKFYDCTEILNKINNSLDTKVSLSSLQKSGQIIYGEATKYYIKLNELVEKVLNNDSIFYDKFSGNKNISDNEEVEIKVLSGDEVYNNEFTTNIINKSSNTCLIKLIFLFSLRDIVR